jgi:predicted DNA binding CopG/RHH family protein
MQQAAIESSAPDPSFAGLLASLAAPPQPTEREWNDALLADDIATFSYEQAVRSHVQSRPPALEQELAPASESAPSQSDGGASASPDRVLKRASITIRLSEPECAQLRLRAAEAGLTVSAYLRSCTLEVESLRTQVKEALAQLRQSAPAAAGPLPSKSSPPKSSRWSRLWSFGRRLPTPGHPA